MSGVRTLVQAGWAHLAIWAGTALGVALPTDAPDWLQAAVWAGVTLLVTLLLRWLESRNSTRFLGRTARFVARLLMGGITRQPVRYARMMTVNQGPLGRYTTYSTR